MELDKLREWVNSLPESEKEAMQTNKFSVKYLTEDREDLFEGLEELFSYAHEAYKDWNSLENIPYPLLPSFNFWSRFLQEYKKEKFSLEYLYSSREFLNKVQSFLDRSVSFSGPIGWGFHSPIMRFEWPETQFLIGLQTKNQDTDIVLGAYYFFTDSIPEKISSKIFQGLAHAAYFRDHLVDRSQDIDMPSILIGYVERVDKLKKETLEIFEGVRANLQEKQREESKKIETFITNAQEQHDKLVETRNTIHTDLIKSLQKENEAWRGEVNETRKRLEELEQVYGEHLKIKEPEKYWGDRAKDFKKRGRKATMWLVMGVIGVPIAVGFLLFFTPSDVLSSFFEANKAPAIRWTLMFLSILTLAVFGIRFLSKFAISSFHLARDAEERETLSYLYLALLKDSQVEKEDRKLVLQALFSRADTGLLKSDSSPTLPNNILDILKKGSG